MPLGELKLVWKFQQKRPTFRTCSKRFRFPQRIYFADTIFPFSSRIWSTITTVFSASVLYIPVVVVLVHQVRDENQKTNVVFQKTPWTLMNTGHRLLMVHHHRANHYHRAKYEVNLRFRLRRPYLPVATHFDRQDKNHAQIKFAIQGKTTLVVYIHSTSTYICAKRAFIFKSFGMPDIGWLFQTGSGKHK